MGNRQKQFYFLLLVLISCISFSQQRYYTTQSNGEDESKIEFAKMIGENVVFSVDTLLFKKYLKDNLFPDTAPIFDKVEVIKQKTLGEVKKDFYYVLIKDSAKNLRISKWLNRIGDTFYLNDKIEEGPLFEQTYLVCIGENDCLPEVFIMDEIRQWGCSKEYICTTEPNGCKAIKSVLFDE